MDRRKLFLGAVSAIGGITSLVCVINFLHNQTSSRYLDQQMRIYKDKKSPEIVRDFVKQQIIRYMAEVDSRKGDVLQRLMGNYGKSLAVDEFYRKNKEFFE